MRFWICCSFIFFTASLCYAEGVHSAYAVRHNNAEEDNVHSADAVHNVYGLSNPTKNSFLQSYLLGGKTLSSGESRDFDAKEVCKHIFVQMSAEGINLAIGDIRRFIRESICSVILDENREIDRSFLINILHIHGHVIRFIESAWVDLDTKKVFKLKDGKQAKGNAIPLSRYWALMERNGEMKKLHCYKFYASCIDYLIVLIRSHFLTPCRSRDEFVDMEDRWIHWLVERLGCKLDGHPDFGGYYDQNIKHIQ